jgi:hypothetical protein
MVKSKGIRVAGARANMKRYSWRKPVPHWGKGQEEQARRRWRWKGVQQRALSTRVEMKAR